MAKKILKYIANYFKGEFIHEIITLFFVKRKIKSFVQTKKNDKKLSKTNNKSKAQLNKPAAKKQQKDLQKIRIDWNLCVENILQTDPTQLREFIEDKLEDQKLKSKDQNLTKKLREHAEYMCEYIETVLYNHES